MGEVLLSGTYHVARAAAVPGRGRLARRRLIREEVDVEGSWGLSGEMEGAKHSHFKFGLTTSPLARDREQYTQSKVRAHRQN